MQSVPLPCTKLQFLFGYLTVLMPHPHPLTPESVESKTEHKTPPNPVVLCRYLTGGILRAEQPRALGSKGQDH